MSNKSLVWLAAIGLAMQLAGCTSGEKSSDVADASGEVEATDGAATASTDEALTTDALPEESLGGSNEASHEALKPAEGSAAASPAAPGDELTFNDSPAAPPSMVTEPGADASASSTSSAPPPDNMTPAEPAPPTAAAETRPAEDSSMAMAPPPSEEKPAAPPAPLKKIAAKPWKVGKTWFNGVYFARPGETLVSISQVIYGDDRSSLLKKGNPGYKSRDPKPGDKVYYNSPKRPEDSETLMTFYDEQGLQPEVYAAKSGDNLRVIAKTLLGYDGAWKEVWASNMELESKGVLKEGDQFKYWKSAPTAMTPPPAAGTMNAEATMPPGGAPPNAEASMPPPPPTQAANELPPPPPMPDIPPPPPMEAAPPSPPPQASNDLPPPPPPPPMEATPPPPPPPSVGKAKKAPAGEEEATAMNEDTMITLGMVAVAAAGVAALLVVRRRRKKKSELEAQIGESTHVGT